MCLVVKEEDYKKVKSQGLFVYKRIYANKTSLHQSFLYKFLKIYETTIGFPYVSTFYRCVDIEEGFHSYLKDPCYSMYTINVLCYIPKHAEYILGWDNDNQGKYDTIVSNQIVILGEVNERKTKILHFLIKNGFFNLLKFIGCIKK